MRFIILFMLISLVCALKHNVKSLTESMGQEVIEIGPKVKDLPPDLEEEPSAENIEEKISTTIQVAIKETKKPSTPETRRKYKDLDKIDPTKDSDEARIEQELAEIYKDSPDYKSDSAEVSKDPSTEATKLIARARDEFKFQPDSNNPRDVERFRTSVDDLSCGKEKLEGTDKAYKNAASKTISGAVISALMILNLY